MRVVYIWLTMGPYHIARMNAIASEIGSQNLTVIEICSKDDHNWDLSCYKRSFVHICVFPNKVLSKTSLSEASSLLVELLNSIPSDIIVNGCGYFDFSLRHVLNQFKKSHKLILWSESTEQDNSNNWLKRQVKKFASNIYHGAIVAGKRHQDFLNQIGFGSKEIKIVGNVVDNNFYKRPIESNREKKFLFVGRFLKIKNISVLIEAFSQISDEIPEWDLNLVGDGPERFTIEQIIKKKELNERIHLCGLLSPDKLKKAYHESSIFVLPSYSEPWGLVTNEALSSGLSVIISKQSGVSEILTHEKNALLFDAFDVSELSSLMKTLALDEALRIKLGSQGAKLIQEYSPKIYAENSVEFFKKLIS